MVNKVFIILFVGFIFLSINTDVLAHPGRTDSSGCHTCRTNCASWGLSYGEYHCHSGSSTSSNTQSDTSIQDALNRIKPQESNVVVPPVQPKQILLPMPTLKPLPTVQKNNEANIRLLYPEEITDTPVPSNNTYVKKSIIISVPSTTSTPVPTVQSITPEEVASTSGETQVASSNYSGGLTTIVLLSLFGFTFLVYKAVRSRFYLKQTKLNK